jgi:anaerobic magnesium-protoporphyrin IX monomethyl ester cyclase
MTSEEDTMGTRKKVYLLYPPISKMERYSSGVGSVGGEQIPLGIYYVAAYLRRYGYDVFVTDAEALGRSEEEIMDEVAETRPDFIGIGSTTVAFHRALRTAEMLKQSFPEIPVVLGGPHVTSNPEHALSFEPFDFGVVGEGELTALELFDALSDGKPVDHVPGLAFRDGSGKVVLTGRRQYIADLDDLPFPAFDLIPDIGLYTPPPSNYRTLPVVNMITSRGCPSLCTFCDRNVFGRRYRERSADNIFGEIRALHERYGIREIAFVDDTFLLNKRRIYSLFERVERAGMHFHWTCMSRIDNVTFDFLSFLRKNGCWSIAFGIESGDEGILKVIRKEISLERTTQVLQWCRKLGIRTKGFFIVGHPLETAETIEKTIRFACRSELDAVVVTLNTPIPGSFQYERAKDYGTLDTADWSKFNYWRPVFVPAGLSESLLLKKQKEFYLRFYLKPRIMFGYATSFFGRGGLRRFKSIMKLFRYLLPLRKAPSIEVQAVR